MAGKECIVICRPRWGKAEPPKRCSSLKEAKEYAKKKMMTYKITDLNGRQITRGF